jgi:hypothetical protein
MKKVLLAGLVMFALTTASFAKDFVAAGKTNTIVGDYRIEVADKPVTINGEELKTFVISYQNSPLKVTVVVKKEKDCKNYIVLSDKLTVQYVCNGKYFGVQKLDKSYSIEGFSNTEAALNRSEYFHQKLIVQGMREETENTQLIAAYFPMLINSEVLATM